MVMKYIKKRKKKSGFIGDLILQTNTFGSILLTLHIQNGLLVTIVNLIHLMV